MLQDIDRPAVALLLTVLLSGCGSAEDTPATPEEAPEVVVAESVTEPVASTVETSSFVEPDFDVPVRVETEDFVIVPLGPELVDIDYAAYMSSIDHLQQTFTRSTGWPREGITDEEAMLDMETEQARFEARSSFAYAVLTPDGLTERGCVYVRPASKPGYDAEVRLWVTQAEFDAGFDPELQTWVEGWVDEAWPFAAVAYPGRQIDWETWDALPDA